jgi:segregation and condensation protein B
MNDEMMNQEEVEKNLSIPEVTPLETESMEEISEEPTAQMSDMSSEELTSDEVLIAEFEEEMEQEVALASSEEVLAVEADESTTSEDTEGEFSLEQEFMDPDKQEDQLWKARTGLNEDSLCGAIETVVFMSDRPLPLVKIKNLIDEDIPLRVLHTAINRLQEGYEQSHHGLRLMEVAEGYQFRTKATYSKYVQDLFKVNSLMLSPTALEVLAIIAYKQPVSKVEIEKIRGVDSSHIVRGLMDKRLVKVSGRSDEMGRPVLYGTTLEFLEVFNLETIDHLPPESELHEMIDEGIGKITDIKSLVQAGDKSRFVFDEMDELENLSSKIKGISADTPFTKSLKLENTKRVDESGAKKKSAFDILEEYVSTDQVTRVNQEAAQSETMLNSVSPQIIRDLLAGPFNLPELMDEEEEDFQMIDLDTGLPIEDDETSLEGEAQALSDALDKAFEDLTGQKIDQIAEELELSDEIVEASEELDNKTQEIVNEAQELDIDLDFMTSTTSDGDQSENMTEDNGLS